MFLSEQGLVQKVIDGVKKKLDKRLLCVIGILHITRQSLGEA